jgi:RNA polymerase sigma factor for flagellar operon FliA
VNTAIPKAPDLRGALRTHGSLVRSIAHRIRARTPDNVEFDDLMQAGMIGLNEAVQRFDDRRSCGFGTYASRRIEGAMLDTLRADDRVSRQTRARLRQVKQAVQKLEHQLGRVPRAKEVADALGWTLSVFHALMAEGGAGQLRSLDDSPESAGDELDEDAVRGADQAAPTTDPLHSLQWRQRCEALVRAIAALEPRHRQVLELIYDADRSLADIGRELGVTESRICQIHSKAVQQLQRRLQAW